MKREPLVTAAILTGLLGLAFAANAGLLVMLFDAGFAKGAFAVQLPFQAAERLVHGFTFFHSYFSHLNITTFRSKKIGEECLYRVAPDFSSQTENGLVPEMPPAGEDHGQVVFVG